jgi:hypothetical protein
LLKARNDFIGINSLIQTLIPKSIRDYLPIRIAACYNGPKILNASCRMGMTRATSGRVLFRRMPSSTNPQEWIWTAYTVQKEIVKDVKCKKPCRKSALFDFIGSFDALRRAQGRSIGKKPNCWLFETPISLYYLLTPSMGFAASRPAEAVQKRS